MMAKASAYLRGAAAVQTLLVVLYARPPNAPQAVVIFTGDIRGYLSPCGCTSPQIGGVKRLAGVVRAMLKQPNAYYVDIGNWTNAIGRQDQLKAEALASVFKSLNPVYLNVGPKDLALGDTYLRTLNEISGGALASSNARSTAIPVTQGKVAGPLFIQGLAGSLGDEQSLADVAGYERVLLVSSGIADAKKIAAGKGLVIYSQPGDPPKELLREGNTAYVTPGDRARNVGKIELVDGEWKNFALIELGPEKSDDPFATETYRMYEKRISDENLLNDIPRGRGPAKFIGSANCLSCHKKAYKIWSLSSHALSFSTLQKVGNSRDPECVGCHVTGLTDVSGFRDPIVTRKLANVGCESCHGAGSLHARAPKKFVYPKVGQKSCLSCHTSNNSPGFNFVEYWKKIKH